MAPPTVLHAASEVVGFSKTGGLADVVGSLPRALERLGCSCAVITPLYRGTRLGKMPLTRTEHQLRVPVGGRMVTGRLWRSTLPDSTVPVYLVEQPEYFERDDPDRGASIYQHTQADGTKADYPDNCERYTFFSRAVLEALPYLDQWPTILHNHDWQTGLVPVYLREEYTPNAEPAERARYQAMRTVFTIHNIAYQGLFPASALTLTGLSWSLFTMDLLEYHGSLSLLKAGIVYSDWITTVSPRYAQEIQTPYYGFGLQGVLTARSHQLSGIVNGADYAVWDPAHDQHLAATYDADTVAENKPRCKQALQKRFGLAEKADAPLCGMVSRLVDQKGLDLLSQAAATMLKPGDVQWVVLGEGDPVYHKFLQQLRQRHPKQVGLLLGFDEALAHQIEAGADIYLMPSLFEPSGLNQLYSLRYGTVPVVRATGGLADTIVDCTPETLAARTATGFRFLGYSAEFFLEALNRALDLYRKEPATWLELVRTCMKQDWSWNRSAAEYEKLYQHLLAEED
jgi:starch synthase